MLQAQGPAQAKSKGPFEKFGCWFSDRVAAISGHPFAQIGFMAFCGIWFLIGWQIDLLTAALSMLAITLTQMVLNSQQEREREAHRRDLALHTKLDELLIASKSARDEIAGIEELEEEEIEALKQRVARVTPLRRAAG